MRLTWACAIVLCLIAAAARGAPGDLDTSFGDAGIVTLAPGATNLGGWVVALPDGGVVVAGRRVDTTGFFTRSSVVVARYRVDGSLDPLFGTDGVAELLFVPDDVIPRSIPLGIARRPDGALVVGGIAIDRATGNAITAVMQLTADGTLDPTFGHGGIARVPPLPDGRLVDFRITATGEVVLGEDYVADGRRRWIARRLHRDGAIDDAFGTNGIAEPDPFAPMTTQLEAIEAWPGGSIALVGAYIPDTGPVVGLGVRLRPDGKLDRRFGKAGIVEFGDGMWPAAATVAPDGRLLVATYGFSVFRLLPEGDRDRGFGTGGVASVAMAGPAFSYAMARSCDGGILLAGQAAADQGSDYAFTLARLTANGSLDPGFGDDGIARTQIGQQDAAVSLALGASGRVFAGGSTGRAAPLGRALAVASYEGGAVCERPCDADGRLALHAGTIALALELDSADVDPVASGARIVLTSDRDGAVLLDALAPPGAFDPTTRAGWRRTPLGQVWSFRDPTGSVRRLSLRHASTGLRVRARLPTLAFGIDALPVRATVEVLPAAACAHFGADQCVARAGSRVLACR